MIVDHDKENGNSILKEGKKCFMPNGGFLRISGMEHERPNSSSGIYDDDEAEIDAAAALSEIPLPMTPLHVQVNGFSGSGSEPSSISGGQRGTSIDSVSTQQYLEAMKQRTLNKKQEYQFQRPSTSMGPPSASTSMIALSPASNWNTNGFQKTSAESSPVLLAQQKNHTRRPPYQSNPLSTSTIQSSPSSGPSSSGSGVNRPSSLQSPINQRTAITSNHPPSTRKDIEMGQRRAICENIRGLREENGLTTFIPQIQSQTETQCAIIMRKNRHELTKDMPTTIRNTVFSEKADDTADNQRIAKLLRDNLILRQRGNEPDDLTDISEDEEEESALTRARRKDLGPSKIALDKFRWSEYRMRLGGQMVRSSILIQEKHEQQKLLGEQLRDCHKSSGVRFEGEEFLPRKRRVVDGSIVLFGTGNFDRSDTEKYGCARARPMTSWTKRDLVKDVFEAEKYDYNKPSSSTLNFQQLPQHFHNQVTVGAKDVVTHLTYGDDRRRETKVFEYQTFEEGKGAVGLKSLADMDAIDYIAPRDYRPMETRIMSYFYKVSTIPGLTIRKTRDRSIFMRSGSQEKTRNGTEKMIAQKDRAKEMRERKRRREMSSDDEDWKDESGKESARKKSGRRGSTKNSKKTRSRPVGVGVRSSISSTRANRNEFPLDDYYMDEPLSSVLPKKMAYAKIILPTWKVITPGAWLKKSKPANLSTSPTQNAVELPTSSTPSSASSVPTTSSEVAPPPDSKSTSEEFDELWLSVANAHHRLMYLERDRLKRDKNVTKKNRPGEKKKVAAGLMSPATSQPADDCQSMDESIILQNMPPFDAHEFANPQVNNERRKFASFEPPFEKRSFPLNNGQRP